MGADQKVNTASAISAILAAMTEALKRRYRWHEGGQTRASRSGSVAHRKCMHGAALSIFPAGA
jgi:hypothetical protein